MLNRLALCLLMRGLVLRTAQSAQLSARQLRAKQSSSRASCRSSLHHDPAPLSPKGCRRKTLVKQAITIYANT